jgi:hypothetical protein
VVHCVEGAFDVELEEGRNGPVAPRRVRRVDYYLDCQVGRPLRPVPYLRLREESLRLHGVGDAPADD